MFADHPAPANRRAASLALAARFPEREEYVINTSEFNKVKARLLRLTNARVTTTGDIKGANQGTSGRPTLKRRQPTPEDNPTQPADGTEQRPSNEKPEPPTLKRHTDPGPQQPATSQPGDKP